MSTRGDPGDGRRQTFESAKDPNGPARAPHEPTGGPDLSALRMAYGDRPLSVDDVAPEPVTQFSHWLTDVVAARLPEPNAMVLSTADGEGRPSSRTVLLKGFSAEGFIFYTNHGSRKARELAVNPRAGLLFPWHALHRQVIVEGPVVRLSHAETATYFRVRPYGSQIGAWASRQSTIIASRAELEERYADLEARWPEPEDVPVPGFWGGYRVIPEAVEFWQGRRNRLHDRLRYRRENDVWIIERLSP